jgi:roadblock/LC7 domain-containing protein
MSKKERAFYAIAIVVATFVTGSAVAAAVRQGSWAPMIDVGWLPAVFVAVKPGAYRSCLPRRAGGSAEPRIGR